jgi:hypothetical protein
MKMVWVKKQKNGLLLWQTVCFRRGPTLSVLIIGVVCFGFSNIASAIGGTAPSVFITSPGAGMVAQGDNVVVDVTANAATPATITQVKLLVNGTVFATDTNSPYTFSWDSVDYGTANGRYSLTAEALDSNGLSTISAPITILVDNADLNSDGTVNISDLAIMATNWGVTSGATYSQGSILDNGAVNIADLAILATNWGTTDTDGPGGTQIAVGIAVDDSDQQNNDEIANYAGAVGTNPDFVQWYQAWSEPLYYAGQETSVVGNNLTPIISWTSDTTPLTSISDGSEDSTIDAAANLAKQWPGTLYIRFDYEMNVSSSEWNPSNLGETPADFVSAWQYIVNRFNTDGVTNVQWIWSPNVDCNGLCPFDSYYPGSTYVNMVGLDGYNYAWVDDVNWETFAALFQNSYNDIVALAPGKPVDIAETASAEANSSEMTAGDSKASWIQQMADYIPSNMPAVTAITWWSAEGDQATMEVNSSLTSLSAWVNDIVDNPTYQANLP